MPAARRPASLSSGGPGHGALGVAPCGSPVLGNSSNGKGHSASDAAGRRRGTATAGQALPGARSPRFCRVGFGPGFSPRKQREQPPVAVTRPAGQRVRGVPGDSLRPGNGDVEDEGEDGDPVAPHVHVTRACGWGLFPWRP